MHAVFSAPGVFLVVFGRFFSMGHHLARGLPTCTRLKKVQATACVKIGWPIPEMAVLSLFCYVFSCHLWAAEDLSPKNRPKCIEPNEASRRLFSVRYCDNM